MIVALIKLLTFFLRRFTSYSATALPGLLIEKYFPATASKLFSQLDQVVVVTGTNGKTTTVHMISELLRQNGMPFITNRSGSNMTRGLLSTLVDQSNWRGVISTKLAVLEVEEATLPRLVKHLKPQTIVVTNIYRDQLDAYGEIDKTFEYLATAIKESNNSNLVLNGDDERVLKLSEFSKGKKSLISFEESYLRLIKSENRSPVLRKEDSHIITGIRTDGDSLSNTFEIRQGKNTLSVFEPIPGAFNCFSATAALLAFASIVGRDLFLLSSKYDIDFGKLRPAFGRGEILEHGDTRYQIFLGKNPAGLSLNLHLLAQAKAGEAILLILNDNTADGRDVSWIWDVDLSALKSILSGSEGPQKTKIFVAGTRGLDMALRLKYEGIREVRIFKDIGEAIREIGREKFEKVYVLPTYTAMLDFRKALKLKIV